MAFYGSSARYDSGVRYASHDSGAPPILSKKMAKVKLELKDKTDVETRDMGLMHKTSMATTAGLANFPIAGRTPTDAAYDTALDNYTGTLTLIEQKEIELAQLRATKDVHKAALEDVLTARGTYVELASGGDETKILSSGFAVQSPRTVTSSLPPPQNVTATMGPNPGEIIVSCKSQPKVKVWIIECRLHSDNAVPGPWTSAKTSGRSTTTLTGLTSGQKYAFRLKAMGPNDVESPFSDEAVCMAP